MWGKSPGKDFRMNLTDNAEESIVSCEEEKYLGVVFDSSLHFDKHIQSTISKANQMVGLIKRTLRGSLLPLIKYRGEQQS